MNPVALQPYRALVDRAAAAGQRSYCQLFADRGVSRGQRNGSPRPLISVYRTWIASYFIQVAPQLTYNIHKI
jgi:hypothetical protein